MKNGFHCNPRYLTFHMSTGKQVVGDCGGSFYKSLVSPPSPALPSSHSTDASVFPLVTSA